MDTFVSLLFPVLMIVILVLSVTRPAFRGRKWFIMHMAVALFTSLAWQVPNMMRRYGSGDLLWFYRTCGPALSVIGLVGLGLLIPFLLEAGSGEEKAGVKSDSGAGMGGQAGPMTIQRALFSFEGRMRRADYWLKGALVLLPIGILNNILIFGVRDEGAQMLAVVIGLATLWPGLALVVKRLHDRNRDGWLAALMFIPIVGAFIAIWLMIEVWFLRGTQGDNRFGPDPLAVAAAEQPSQSGPAS